jgi:hypothetical protein
MWHWNKFGQWLSIPDDGAGSGASAAATPAAPAAPAAAPPAAPAPAPAEPTGSEGSTVSAADQFAAQQAAAAAANPNSAVAQQVTPAAAAPGAPSPAPAAPITVAGVRAFARSVGIDPAHYSDDATMLRDVFAAAQQAQTYRTQAQQLAQQQAALLQRMGQPAQQQAAPQQPGQAQNPLAKFWQPPEFQPQWEQLVTRDAQGNVNGVKPGAPVDILPKYLAYHQYRRDFADRLLSNPVEALGPMVQEMAAQQAQRIMQGQMQTYQDRTWTDSFMSQNSQWLHARDAAGNLLTNHATGRPMLSPAGQRFGQYVVEAERMGVGDIRQQERFARSMLQRDLLMGQQQQAQAPAHGAAAQAAAVAAANRRPNLAGSVPAAGPIPATVAQNSGLSLKDQLAQAMQSQGVTDDQVNL